MTVALRVAVAAAFACFALPSGAVEADRAVLPESRDAAVVTAQAGAAPGGPASPRAADRVGEPAVVPAAPSTVPGDDDEDDEDDAPQAVNDPLEPFNRAVFTFNQKLDDVAIRPLARGYEAVVPPPVRLVIGNVFANVGDVWTGVNNLLQGKPAEAGEDALRVLVNTTFGLGGIADVATDFGLQRHNEDFGQTLGRWGVPSGAYLMLPVFGPSTVRDAGGFLLDVQADPSSRLEDPGARNGLRVVKIAHTRARLLRADPVFEGIALDRYLFVRDAYLQRRRSLVYDGDPPPDRRR